MQKEIILQSSNDLEHYTGIKLVPNDVQAYKIVLKTPYDLTGASFKVTAKRIGEEIIEGVGTCVGNTAYYTLANNMYSQGKEVHIRLTLFSAIGSVLTEKELIFDIAEDWGESDISGDNRVPALDTLIIQVTDKINQANTALNDLNDAENELIDHITDSDIHVLPEDKIDWNKISEVYKGEIALADIDTTKTAGLYQVVHRFGASALLRDWLFVSDSGGGQNIAQYRFFNTGDIKWRRNIMDEETGDEYWSGWSIAASLSDLNTKVNRTTAANRVYATDATGNQIALPFRSSGIEYIVGQTVSGSVYITTLEATGVEAGYTSTDLLTPKNESNITLDNTSSIRHNHVPTNDYALVNKQYVDNAISAAIQAHIDEHHS